MSVIKRCMLIAATLLVLGVALVSPIAAHAQTSTHRSQQQHAVTTDQPEFFFNAGIWGWGYCFSHNTVQSLGNGDGHAINILVYVTSAIFSGNPYTGAIAASTVEAIRWYMEAIDRGNGDCLAFLFYDPELPEVWAR